MVIGMFVFASLISNITNVINDSALNKFEEKMEALDRFFTHRRLPAGLLKRVNAYHQELFGMSHGYDERALLEGLPCELKSQVCRALYRDAIAHVPLFRDCDPSFLDALCTEVQPQICLPGDNVVSQGEIGFEMYFVAAGVCDVVDANGRVFATMAEGSFFGEISLFLQLPRSKSVVARTRMELYSLHKDAFVRVQNYFPVEADKFVKVAQQRVATNAALGRLLASPVSSPMAAPSDVSSLSSSLSLPSAAASTAAEVTTRAAAPATPRRSLSRRSQKKNE